MIPVYVLNLARSPERRAFMAQGLAQAGVAPTFIAAVDGRACRAPPARGISVAETALILSHRKAWRRFLGCGAEFAVVLEDDTHVGEGFAALLAADWRGLGFDAVKLDTMFDPVWMARRGQPFCARELRRLGAEHLGAAGYLVSRPGAQKMLGLTRALDEPVDHSLFGRDAMFQRRLHVLQLLPAIVVQDNMHPDAKARRALATTLHEPDRAEIARRVKATRPRGAARLAREAARLFQQLRGARLWLTMRRARAPWR